MKFMIIWDIFDCSKLRLISYIIEEVGLCKLSFLKLF